jgi:hypothetical protein
MSTAFPAKYLVLRDTCEQRGKGWQFKPSDHCEGTILRNLFTGDYSLEGYYDDKTFVIERKGSCAELVANITHKEKWDDFKDELTRLEEFRFPFVICEFGYSLIEKYPKGSLPESFWSKVRVSPQFLMKRLWEIQLAFKTRFLFCDEGGHNAAASLFKRIVEHVPKTS